MGRASLRLWLWYGFVGLIALAILTAHDKHVDYSHLMAAWSFDPLICGLIALVGGLYLRGVVRRGEKPWKIASFLAGLACLFAALQSPVDAMADRLFFVHQIQHMLLRLMAPMLILLANPQGTIFAGMPRWMRKWLIAPLVTSGGARRLGGWLVRPVPATVIFILGLALWEIPSLHDAALMDERLHYFMHVSMLAAGVIFFWAIFDLRDPPKGVPHGQRMAMLGAAILSDIVIGAFTMLKPMVLYTAYDIEGRLFGMGAMSDESTGGFLIWSPSSMMFMVCLMLVLFRWNGAEARAYARRQRSGQRSNSDALLFPETAEELWIAVREKNRRMGLTLAVLPITLFTLVFGMTEMVLALSKG